MSRFSFLTRYFDGTAFSFRSSRDHKDTYGDPSQLSAGRRLLPILTKVNFEETMSGVTVAVALKCYQNRPDTISIVTLQPELRIREKQESHCRRRTHFLGCGAHVFCSRRSLCFSARYLKITAQSSLTAFVFVQN